MNNYFLNLEILNRVANGNSMAWAIDEKEEEEHYLCDMCSSIVNYDEFDHDKKICKGCTNGS